MFEVKPHKVIIRDLHRIVNNYSPLVNDGEYDVIYTGINTYGSQVLGVIMFDDDDNSFLRYIHTLVTDKQYSDYINKKISLRSILEENKTVFLVDKKYNGSELAVNIATIEEIPEDFLPLQNSYCPDFVLTSTFNYAASLKGRIADMHLAEPDDVNNVNYHISSFIKTATDFINDLALTRRIYVEAMVAGSFKINFKVEISHVTASSLFNVSLNDVSQFMASYFKYVFEKLPNENVDAFKSPEIKSEGFKELEKAFHSLHNSAGNIPPAGVEQKLIDNMNYAIENLKDIHFGRSFDRIEFINYTTSGLEVPAGLIDNKYYESVSDKFFPVEKLTKGDEIEIDEYPKDYLIQVYALNKETGNGSAYLSVNNGIHKILLHLRGKANYQNTAFTHNMDEKEPQLMAIKAIAKRVNGHIVEITYTFDKL